MRLSIRLGFWLLAVFGLFWWQPAPAAAAGVDHIESTDATPVAQSILAPPFNPLIFPPHPPVPSPDSEAPSRSKVIVLDAGHGLPDFGAVNQDLGTWESELTLDLARRATAVLEEAGYVVVLTRTSDDAIDPVYRSGAGNLSSTVYRDLQARIDLANQAGADLFFSLHMNGATDPDLRGFEVWYNANRAFAEDNERLAELALTHIPEAMRAGGYKPTVRGVYADPYDDPAFGTANGRPMEIFVLEPGTHPARPHPPTNMPGIVVEHAFMTNIHDASAMTRREVRQEIAHGYLATVEAFFQTVEGE